MSRAQAADLLEASSVPMRSEEMQRIRAAYGDLADDVAAGQAAFLNLTDAGYDDIKRKILAHWDDIQAIAAQVPAPEAVAQLLRTVGGPVTVEELGLSQEEQAQAIASGHYLRDRFTVRKLARVLTID